MNRTFVSTIFISLVCITSVLGSGTEGQLCSLCDGLSNTDCSLKVDSIISKLSSDELYKFYTSTTSTSLCDDIEQQSCLEKMSGYFLQMDFEDKIKYFTKGCDKESDVTIGEKLSDYSTCFLCESISDMDCLDLLKGTLNSMDSDLRLTTEQKIYPNVCSDSMSDEECLSELDLMISQLADSDLLGILSNGCLDGLFGSPDNITPLSKEGIPAKPVVSHLSSSIDCSLCSGISDDDECVEKLMNYLKTLDSNSRLDVEKNIFNGECENIPDSYCLAFLDELLLSIKNSELQTLLFKSCASGMFDESEHVSTLIKSVKKNSVTLSVEKCNLCDSLSVTDCQNLLTSKVESMNDKARLAFEKSIFDIDVCDSKTDKECLSILDIEYYGLSDEDRLITLSEACLNNLFDQSQSSSNHLTTHNSDSCSFCNDLDDDECLLSLTESLQSTSGHVRMTVELEILDEDCSNLNDNSCLKYLDSVFESLSDAERLSALKTGCNTGLIHVTSLSSVFKSRPMTLSYISLSQFFVVLSVITAFVTYYRRRERNNYIAIPDKNIELEI